MLHLLILMTNELIAKYFVGVSHLKINLLHIGYIGKFVTDSVLMICYRLYQFHDIYYNTRCNPSNSIYAQSIRIPQFTNKGVTVKVFTQTNAISGAYVYK